MEGLLPIIYNQTFKLLDLTLQKKALIKESDFYNLLDNYVNMFKIINNAVINNTIDEKQRKDKNISMNDKVIEYAENLRNKIKNNKSFYIIEETDNQKNEDIENNSQNKKKNENQIGDNDTDIILADKTQTKSFSNINESQIKFLLNDTSTTADNNSFKELSIVNESLLKFLYLDTRKDLTVYRTNYIFKSDDGNIIYKIYKNLKKNQELKKAIMIEINLDDNDKIYVMIYIS